VSLPVQLRSARRRRAAAEHDAVTHQRVLREVAVLPLRLYRLMLSPLLPPSCRFHPPCSAYAVEAVVRYGIARGGWLAVRRVARCRPASPGGHDPVPSIASR
jgi:putative membrane protein insertion efficiency factor